MTPEQINYYFQHACLLDVSALKPGNVGWHGCGYGMDSADFIASAAACGHSLCAPNISLGERIFHAIKKTRQVVSCNTNLGIVLLCAPIIHAALQLQASDNDLQDAVRRVLAATNLADTQQVLAAIRLAQPGGMGILEANDIGMQSTLNLCDMMRLAANRDMVAAQYADNYRFVFDEVVPLFIEIFAQWEYHSWSVAGVYMTLLGRYPDSLIARKRGSQLAEDVSATVKPLAEEFIGCTKPQDFEQRLLKLDRYLKQNDLNPGTTADVVVSGVLVASLEGALRGTVKTPY